MDEKDADDPDLGSGSRSWTRLSFRAGAGRARAGFAIAPILYLLGLVGVGAAVLFSGYSQILRTNQNITYNLQTKNDLNGNATTMAATSVLSADTTVLCPPTAGSPSANCTASTIKLSAISGQTQLPANTAGVAGSGGTVPKEVGVFTAGSGMTQLDAWGHYYIVCRWENPTNPGSGPAFMIISAGPSGNLQTKCTDTTAKGDNLIIEWPVTTAVNRSAVWQATVSGGSTTSVQFGQVGSQLVVDATGDLTVPGWLHVNGASTLGSVSAGSISASSGSFSGSLSAGSGSFSSLAVSGNETVGGTLGVTGATTLAALTAGATTLTSAVISNNATVGGTLGVTGLATLNSVAVTGNETVGGTLGVTGAATFGSTLSTTGLATLNSLAVTNNAAITGTLSAGASTLDSLTVTNNETIGGNLTVTGTTHLVGQLNGSSAVFTGNVQAANFIGTVSGGSISWGTAIVPLANGGSGYAASSTLDLLTYLGGTNASNLTSGTLPAGRIAAGEITSGMMAAPGADAGGPYYQVYVDSAGRVTSDSTSVIPIPASISDGAGDSITADATNGLTFSTSSSARMRIDRAGKVSIGTTTATVSFDLSKETDALALPSGTTAQRPGSPVNGEIRYNGDVGFRNIEAYINGAWSTIATTTGGTGIVSGVILGTSTTATNPQRNGDVSTGLFSPAVGSVAVSSAGTEMVRVDGTGLGIGKTASYPLDVNGVIRSTGGTDGYLYLDGTVGGEIHFTKSGASKWGFGTDVGAANDDLNVYSYTGTAVRFSISDSTGNVGIGSTSPVVSLDIGQKNDAVALPSGSSAQRPGSPVNGELRYNSDSGIKALEAYVNNAWTQLLVGSGAGLTTFLGTSASGTNPQRSGQPGTGLFSAATNTVSIATNSTEALRVDAGGNVGIGTASPATKLEVNGAITVANASGVNFRSSGGALDGAILEGAGNGISINAGSSGNIYFNNQSGATTWMNINNGNVGIANTSPGAKLDIGSAGATLGTMRLEGNTSGYVQIQPTAVAGSWTMTLPSSAGTASYVLQTDGSGNTSWVNLGGGGAALNLGTSAAATNPQRTGQAGTGLFSATTNTVSIAAGGTDEADFASTGLNLPVATESYQINGNNALWQDVTNFNVAVGKTALSTTVSQSGGGSNGQYNTAIGQVALNANTTGQQNTAVGAGALSANTTGQQNTAMGTNALNGNTTGSNNTSVGQGTLTYNTTGSGNTALGQAAMQLNTTGYYNTAVGTSALYSNTTGQYNVGVGSGALTANTTGIQNTGVGTNALNVNTTGSYNTAVGLNTLISDTTGLYNTAVGQTALNSNTTGSFNTAVGMQALFASTTSYYNTVLGYRAGFSVLTGTDNTLVGYGAGYGVTGSNNIVLGEDPSSAITTGSNNILIGNSLTTGLTNTASNQINIGNTITGKLVAASGGTALVIGTSTDDGAIMTFAGVGAITLPNGSTAQRPGSAANGMIRYNADSSGAMEAYINGAWESLVTGTGSTSIITLGTSASATNPQRNGQAVTGLFSAATNTVSVATNGTEALRVDATGQVGIGTSGPAAKLHVLGGTILQLDDASAAPAQLLIRGQSNNNQNLILGYNTTGDYGSIGALKQGTSWEPLILNSGGGNVGIGTTSPLAKLDFGASLNRNLSFYDDGTNALSFEVRAGSYEFNSRGAVPISFGSKTYASAYGTAPNYLMTIATSGNVGIGTTAPASALHVYRNSGYGDIRTEGPVYAKLYLKSDNGAADAKTWQLYSDSVSNALFLGALNDAENSQSLAMQINRGTGTAITNVDFPNGNVGIGTTAPLGKFQVLTSTDTTPSTITAFDARHVSFGPSTGDAIAISKTTAGSAYLSSLRPGVAWDPLAIQASTLSFNPGGATSAFFVNSSGSVGIGNTSPNAKLDIGSPGATLGTMRLEGNTSGYVQIQPAAAAGSWTMTLPTGAGTNNYVLTTDGSGNTSWTNLGGSGTALNLGTSASATNPQRPGQAGTGFYSDTSNQVEVAIGGANLVTWTSSAENIAGTISQGSYSIGYKINGNNALWQDAANANLAVGNTALPTTVAQGGAGYGVGDTAVGIGALNANTTGGYNAAFGDYALNANTTGTNNTAMGNSALGANTTSSGNTGIGSNALVTNTTGFSNTAVGNAALFYNLTGTNNTAVGNAAIQGIAGVKLTGSYNTGVGDSSLFGLQGAAAKNTALGYKAGYAVTTGTDNTLLGYEAGLGVTGNSNIIIGEDPSSAITSGGSNILIGNSLSYGLTNSASNQINIGNTIFGNLKAASGGTALTIGTAADGGAIMTFAGVGAITLPNGSTAQRPGSAANGMIRYNADSSGAMEAYINGAWESLVTGTGSTSIITLGTSASATNPQRNGQAGTGLFSATTNTVSIATAGTEALRVDASGNVGIGTTAPGDYLNVLTGTTQKGITVQGSVDNVALTLTNNDASGHSWGLYSAAGGSGAGVGSFGIYDNTAAAYRMVINSGGLVGIGTATPAAMLDVGYAAANTTASTPALIVDNPSGGSHTTLSMRINNVAKGNIRVDSAGDLVLSPAGGTTYVGYTDLAGANAVSFQNGAVYFDATGHVGIGNTSPGAKLDIGSAGATLGTMRLEGNTSGYVQIQPTAAAGSWTLTLPSSAGTANYVLTTDGAGNTSWTSLGGGGTALNLGTSAAATNPQRSGQAGTGLFSAGSNTVSIAAGGADVDDITATGENILGTITQGSYSIGYKINGNNAIWQDATNYNLALGATSFPTTVDQTGGSGNGQQNTAVGYHALNANTTGQQNTAYGYLALVANTTGVANTAIGASAMASNTTGQSNTAIGFEALNKNTIGGANVSIGYYSLGNDTTGGANVAIGNLTLNQNTTGNNNVAIGYAAGYDITTGGQNIIIGYYPSTGVSITTGSGNILFGSNLQLPSQSGNNQLDIGNLIFATGLSSGNTLSTGSVGIGNTSPGAKLDIGSAGTTLGTMRLEGNTSGYVQIQPTAAAGSWTLTLPSSAGTANYVLQTDGSGNTSWVAQTSTASINLGTSATATSPQRSGQAGTGLYSATSAHVSVAVDVSGTGTQVGDFTSVGLNLPGTGTSYKLNSINALWQDNTNFNLAVGDTAFPTTVSQTGGAPAGQYDTAVGYLALNANTTGYDNTAVGTQALAVNVTGNNNTAIGTWALISNTVGAGNTALGSEALDSNTTGNSNTAAGYAALYYNLTGSDNTAFGYTAMQGITGTKLTGNYNTGIGDSALYVIQGAGAKNTVLGYKSGYAVTTGTDNTLVGYQAGLGVTGNSNIIVGEDPSSAITSGASNILIGNSLSYGLTNTSNNQINIGDTIFGKLKAAAGGTALTIGTAADGGAIMTFAGVGGITLPAGSTAQRPGSAANGMVRYNSDSSGAVEAYINGAWTSLVTSGGSSSTITLGTSASATNPQRSGQAGTGLYSATTNTVSIAANGTDEADFASTGLNLPVATESYKIAGNNAVWQDTTNLNFAAGWTLFPANVSQSGGGANGQKNTAVGIVALSANTTGYGNTAVGTYALYANTTGQYNTAVGSQALGNSTTGFQNIAVGSNALYNTTTGSYSTAVGYAALFSNTTGQNNTAFGDSALYDNTTGYQNTAVGFGTLYTNTTGVNNTALGYQAGYDVTTGGHNVIIGDYATTGVGITTGSNNILVGQDVRPTSQTGSNQLNIGNLIYATGLASGSTASTGNVGIGTTSPVAKLHVAATTGVASPGSIALAIRDASSPSYGFDFDLEGVSTGDLSLMRTVAGSQSQVMTFQRATGNVGIGTTSPQQSLDVAGIIRSTGAGGNVVDIDAYGSNTGPRVKFGIPATPNSYFEIGAYNSVNNIDTKGRDLQIFSTSVATGITFKQSSGNVGIANTSPGALLDIGSAGMTLGTMRLEGNTSGYVQVQAAAAAGSWTMTLPTSAGTSGYVLSTNGSGVTSWVVNGSGATINLGTSAAATNPQRSGQAGTGLFSASTNTVSIAASGTDEADFASTGLNLPVATESYKIGGNNAVWQDTTNFNLAVGGTVLPTTVSQSGGGSNGQFNMAVGQNALNANTTGYQNIAVGISALYANTTGIGNTALGYAALYNNITGAWNVALGAQSLEFNTTGQQNTAVGTNALYANTAGFQNTALGFQALDNNTTGNYSTAIGLDALFNNTTGYANTATGYLALYTNSTGYYNTAVGYQSLEFNTTGFYNTAVGMNALNLNTKGANNTAVGVSALGSNTTASNNTALGFEALYSDTTGQYNVVVGATALFSNTTGSYNTALGYQAGYDVTTGGHNVIIGDYATTGAGITTGSNNILIGQDLRELTNTSSNQLDIGNLIYATGLASGTTMSTGSVGIGTATPAQTLDVNGTMQATQLQLSDQSVVLSPSSGVGIGIGTGRRIYFSTNAFGLSGGYDAWIYRSAANTLAMHATNLFMDGNVGIADTSPGALLDIGSAGTTLGTMRLEGNTSGYVQVQSAAAAGSWTMTLPTSAGTSGYVPQTNGSGVTSWVSPGSGSTINLGTSAAATNPQRSGQAGTGLFSAATNTVSVATNGTEALRIDASGQVGIGTTSPAAKLDVTGISHVTSTDSTAAYSEEYVYQRTVAQAAGSYTEIAKFNSNNGGFSVEVDMNDPQSGGSASKKYIMTGSYDDYNGLGWREILPVSSSGPRGGDYTLDLGGTSVTSGANFTLRLRTTSTLTGSNTSVGIRVKTLNTSLVSALSGTGTGATVSGYFRDTPLTQVQGNVGIGTASPAVNLDIFGSGSTPLYVDTSNAQSFINFRTGNASQGYVGYTTLGTGGMSFLNAAGSTANLLVTNAGNVGIANASPGALLDIGSAGATLGTMRLEGNTSGYVQIQPAAAAGSWTMTLPTSAGTSGYVLQTNGSGVTSWVVNGSGGTATLGTSAAATSPQRSGQAGTGLFSATTNTVSIAANGTDEADFASSGLNLPVATESYKIGGNNAVWQDTTNYNLAVGNTALPTTDIGGGGNGQNNVAVGQQALNANTTGYQNTAVGPLALATNTTGNYNTALGYYALQANTTGTTNTAVGVGSLAANTTGTSSTAVGSSALNTNTTGQNNAALGYAALSHSTTASYNTAVGYEALYTDTTGQYNVVVGATALFSNTTGNGNTALGTNALNQNVTGSYNTALGYQAGYDVTTGGHNVIIGDYATTGAGITTGSNNILIGQDLRKLTATTSNQLDIGNLIYATGLSSGTTMSTGSVGIGTLPGARLLTIGTTSATAVEGVQLISGGQNWYVDARGSADSPAGRFEISQGSSDNFTILTGGNVGIGTSNPGSVLTVNGQVDVLSHKIVNVTDPTSNQDAATKAYVDSHSGNPANWTCTVRSSTNNFGFASVSCSGSEKVVSGGCSATNGIGTSAPSGQGWACADTVGGYGNSATAYANCCY